ncbi:nucleoside diphosphate-linked moiety X motif 8 [Hoplias malabaricus]|uniref:nucleoside diphosphate-linked moiety X motif 8 n=1 Tax=Hoplias malabaricus TaxID=27720 RepID=UPI003462AB3C
MFRSPQFVSSASCLGTYRSLLMTVKDLQKPIHGRTVCNSSFSLQLNCAVYKEKGHQRKHHCKHGQGNSNSASQEMIHSPFSRLIDSGCPVNTHPSNNVAHETRVLKGGTTKFLRNTSKLYPSSLILSHISISHFSFRDPVLCKCLLLEKQAGKLRRADNICVTHTNTSIISQRSCHSATSFTSFKGNFYCPNKWSKSLLTSSPLGWSHCGHVTTKTQDVEKRVPQKPTLEDCLTIENMERCRIHLRPNTVLYEKEKGKSWAAVLVSLCTVGGEPSFLFTLRSSKLRGRHKGDVSFAGGKRDPSDRNVVDTALREAREELGIAVNENEVWGVLKPLQDSSGMLIAPVLANLGPLEALTFCPNPTEVEEIFTLTVAHVYDPRNRGYTHFRTGDRYGYTLPVFHNAKYRIWGLTAVALDHTLKLIIPV